MKKLLPALALLGCCTAAYAQMPSADQLMSQLDKNKDGVMTKKEAQGSMFANFFDMLDADHDGNVTKEELSKMNGAPPPGAGSPPAGAPAGAPPATSP